MTTLIVFFSWQGHTEKVVSTLAERISAESIRIEPAKPIGIVFEGIKSAFSMKSKIKQIKTDLSDVDTLIIACPVWSGKIPPYVNEYLDKVTNGSGKPFYVLVEMGGRGAESAISVIREVLERKGMIFQSSAVTIEKDVNSDEYESNINNFAEKIIKGQTGNPEP